MLKRRLLLLGGGHTHALLLKRLAMNPLPDVEVLLLAPQGLAPYSGMLPGYLAGFYSYEELHIDLVQLCQAAGAHLILARAQAIDRQKRLILCEGRPALSFDVLSINIGCEPKQDSEGIPVKPMSVFLERWRELEQKRSLAIIGGGAGGVEVALGLAQHFQERLAISLIQRDAELLPQMPKKIRRHFAELCLRRGISLHLGEKNAAQKAKESEAVIWASSAQGPEILRRSGLLVDADGILLTDSQLLCQGESSIFAVGDCARIETQPRPRSGVFAVRLAKPLEGNLRRLFSGQSLRPARLQKQHLALLSTGQKAAVAVRGPFYWRAPWLWTLKDRIDRAFMDRFKDLPPAAMPMPKDDAMRCLGCGAKIEGHLLRRVLAELGVRYPAVLPAMDSETALGSSEDVALVAMTPWVMQSLDYFPGFIEDPFVLGQIACLHAAGDLLAKGGCPTSCLALAVLAPKAPLLLEGDLRQLLSGVADILQTLGAQLVGGHSAEGLQTAIGLHMQGPRPSTEHWRGKGGLQVGDALVLTKGLGTGLLLAALMRNQLKAADYEACLASMLQNQVALLPLIQRPEVHAATDVTGFGLLGHLAEMAKGSRVRVRLDCAKLPLLSGVSEALAKGIFSTLAPGNQNYAAGLCEIPELLRLPAIVFDPQTSGGLLLGIAADRAEAWVAAAHALGFKATRVIGQVLSGGEAALSLGTRASLKDEQNGIQKGND